METLAGLSAPEAALAGGNRSAALVMYSLQLASCSLVGTACAALHADLGGVLDFTGELGRLAIAQVGGAAHGTCGCRCLARARTANTRDCFACLELQHSVAADGPAGPRQRLLPPALHPAPPALPLPPQATRRDEAAVQKARDLTEGIMGQFLQFDLRNGSLRKSEGGAGAGPRMLLHDVGRQLCL